MSPNKQYIEVDPAEHQAMGLIYGCLPRSVSVLNFERAARFNQRGVTMSNYIFPERLQPTSDAATYHSGRVNHQVQAWLGNSLKPNTWGWDLRVTEQVSILKPHKIYQMHALTVLGGVTGMSVAAGRMALCAS